jgi:alpha-tubulin suppressor-like RCC1 family protein
MKNIKASELVFSHELPRHTDLDLGLFLGSDCCVLSSKQSHIWCWGNNHFEKLGFSTYPVEIAPLPVLFSNRINLDKGEYLQNAMFGYDHSGYLTNKGDLIMNGKNEFNQLGEHRTNGEYTIINTALKLNKDETIDKIHFSDYRSAVLTNHHRVIFWGLNQTFILRKITKLINTEKKNLKPTDLSEQLNFDQSEKITDFQLVNSTSASMIVVTNGSNLYEVNEKGKHLINPIFKKKNDLKVKALLSYEATHVLLTNEDEVFLWGMDLFNKDKQISTPISIKFPLLNDEIISIKLSDQFLVVLTKQHRIFAYGVNKDNLIMLDYNQEEAKNPIELNSYLGLLPNEKVIQIECNLYNIGIKTSLNRILLWGDNRKGTIGDGTNQDYPKPYEISIHYIY